MHQIRILPPKESQTTEIAYTNQLVININKDCIQKQNFNENAHFMADDHITGVPPEGEEAIREKLLLLLPSKTAGLPHNLNLVVSLFQ